jgi:hypothetical protein
MDGFKEHLKHSIRLRLSVWLSAVILIMAFAAGALSGSVATSACW